MPPETDNLQLEELFREDQKDREKPLASAQGLENLWRRDAERRRMVLAFASEGRVRTKNDLYHAGVILYHGQDSEDFVTAHRFAAMAAMMGCKEARWLCAATLDRFLMKLGMPQVYGTQFEHNAATRRYELKLPVEDARVLDFEKEFLGVPTIVRRLEELNRAISSRQGVQER